MIGLTGIKMKIICKSISCMKKLIISLPLIFLSFCAFAQEEKEFVVNGTLRNVEDGTELILIKMEGTFGMEVSSDTVNKGIFKLKWKAAERTEEFSLIRGPKTKGFPSMALKIWAKSGSLIDITGNDKLIYTWKVKSNIPEQIEQSRFINANRKEWDGYQYINVKYANLPKRDTWKSEEKIMADSLNRSMQIIHKRIALINIELLKHNPARTVAGMEVLKEAVSVMKEENDTSKLLELKQLYNKLDKHQKESIEGTQIHAMLYPYKIVREGDLIADGDLFDLNDRIHHLYDYKGKYILLDFWSNGCGACVTAFPKLKEIHEKQKNKLTVISINVDVPSLWKKRNDSHKIIWINLNDKKEFSGITTKYDLRMIPLYVFVSPEGKIIFTTSYWDELERKIGEYIKD